nr:PQQ-binding-like beta-propeller repeat protein [Actinomycetota bacterium]
MRTFVSAAVAVAMAFLTPAATAAEPCIGAVPGYADRCEAWVSTFNGSATGSSIDMAFAAASAPDGSAVYVTGQTWDQTQQAHNWMTIAYDGVTGAERWKAVLDGETERWDYPRDVQVSPDGETVYVTGTVDSSFYLEGDYAVAAYDAADGTLRWTAIHDGDEGGWELPNELVVSPDGSRVFVTGKAGPEFTADVATMAVDAHTGEVAWSAVYTGKDDAMAEGIGIAIAPDGEHVYVTGYSGGHGLGSDYVTVAYDALDGTLRWVSADDGKVGADLGFYNVVSADGARVY